MLPILGGVGSQRGSQHCGCRRQEGTMSQRWGWAGSGCSYWGRDLWRGRKAGAAGCPAGAYPAAETMLFLPSPRAPRQPPPLQPLVASRLCTSVMNYLLVDWFFLQVAGGLRVLTLQGLGQEQACNLEQGSLCPSLQGEEGGLSLGRVRRFPHLCLGTWHHLSL